MECSFWPLSTHSLVGPFLHFDESVRLWNVNTGVCILILLGLVATAMKYSAWLVLFFVLMTMPLLFVKATDSLLG
jgi:WD40 repeat protein